MTPCMQQWRQEDIQYVLREAEKLLMDTAYQLRLPVKVTIGSLLQRLHMV